MAPASTLRAFTQWYSSLDGRLLLLLAVLQSFKPVPEMEAGFNSRTQLLLHFAQVDSASSTDVAQRDG